jgi:hypothetical protein
MLKLRTRYGHRARVETIMAWHGRTVNEGLRTPGGRDPVAPELGRARSKEPRTGNRRVGKGRRRRIREQRGEGQYLWSLGKQRGECAHAVSNRAALNLERGVIPAGVVSEDPPGKFR